MNYYIKSELKKIGKTLQAAYSKDPDAPVFSDFLEDLFDTFIERALQNHDLLDLELFNGIAPQWYS